MAEDVIDLLLEQHSQIELLFIELAECRPDSRAELFDELVQLLAVHETAEEELIHPLARRVDEADGADTDARLAEEHQAKEQLQAMLDSDTTSPQFETDLALLRQSVLEHATREQRYEFPRLRAAHAGELVALVPVFKAAQKLAPTRPHPGVETATANIVTGPFAAVADRVRDAIKTARTG
jgi:hemerythrin superfamily protein